ADSTTRVPTVGRGTQEAVDAPGSVRALLSPRAAPPPRGALTPPSKGDRDPPSTGLQARTHETAQLPPTGLQAHTHQTAQLPPTGLQATTSSAIDVAGCMVTRDVEPEPPPPAPPAQSHTPGPESVTLYDSDDAEDEGLIPWQQLRSLDALLAYMARLFPQSIRPASHTSALRLMRDAYARSHHDSNLDTAISFGTAALARDLRELEECGGDLVAMIRARILARRPARMNVGRVEAHISADNPERTKLLQFALHGVDARGLLPPDFKPNGPNRASWPRRTVDYTRAPCVVNFLLSKAFHADGLVAILP
ncbi:hypothetical protein B484DRAFT_412337, partial [Ochromonadaceae sp. CCMP2298]